MEQNLPPLPPVIFENGLYYELRGAFVFFINGSLCNVNSHRRRKIFHFSCRGQFL